MNKKPIPLIDTLDKLGASASKAYILYPDDFELIIQFLKQYDRSKATFESYRREMERLLQWAWLIRKESIINLDRSDIEKFVKFCIKPPKRWIGMKRCSRYVNSDKGRIPNPDWRPFVVKVSKREHKQETEPDINQYEFSQSSLRALFAVLGRFYEHLLMEEVIPKNPVALIRQKGRYLQKKNEEEQIIRLSDEQWQTLLDATKEMADKHPTIHHRSVFIITAMYLMYLRISEFISRDDWQPSMNHFYRDSDKQWWFRVLGKGNKLRNIAVSDSMLSVLGEYRKGLGLTPLPSPDDNSPLIPKTKGKGGLTNSRQIRRLIQQCFDHAVNKLREKKQNSEADGLEVATVHWLRHTGISDDVNKRGRSILHVRIDAGHNSITTTERYSDVERKDRHRSAREKTTDIKNEQH